MKVSRWTLAIVTIVLCLPAQGFAQDVAQLVAAGRFDEAAELLAAAGPDEADAGATLIFDQAYTGFQAQRYDYATSGFRAAGAVPEVSPRLREQIAFWNGLSLMQWAAGLAREQNLASARVTQPMFQDARALLDASGSFPETVAVNMANTRRALDTFIEIQEAIIRRGY
ncbi:MAG: hypothetical protein ABL963_06810 [Longimicrobiales bacterium]